MGHDSAGVVAGKLRDAVKGKSFPDSLADQLRGAYSRLFELVGLRNDLLHAMPYNTMEGTTQLGRFFPNAKPVIWTVEEINLATQRFEELSTELRRLMGDVGLPQSPAEAGNAATI